MEILLFAVVIIGMFYLMSRMGKRQQQRQREQVSDGLVPGAWVMTIARVYAKVVEVDGDTVTIANPDGSESLIDRVGIASSGVNPPFADALEDSDDIAVPDDPSGLESTDADTDSSTEIDSPDDGDNSNKP